MSRLRSVASALLASATLMVATESGVAPALANDTVAVLGAGGITLSETSHISMEKEDLYISPSEVRVDYVFRNTSDHDIETVVAFPMPDISANSNEMQAISNPDSENVMDFRVTQDGKAIEPQVQHRAIANNIDVTDALDEQEIPVYVLNNAGADAVQALPDDVKADWKARGIAVQDFSSTDNADEAPYIPNWQIRSTYWWKTVFPAGKAVKVHHSYKPGVGGISGLNFIDENGGKGGEYADYQDRYCVNDRFLKLVGAKMASTKSMDGVYYFEKWLSYILVTGANWAGPIGDFHMTVDKEDPETLASFCGSDFRKTSETTYEMRAKDFTPSKNVDILIVYKSDQRQ